MTKTKIVQKTTYIWHTRPKGYTRDIEKKKFLMAGLFMCGINASKMQRHEAAIIRKN